jgi:hypothetical protein
VGSLALAGEDHEREVIGAPRVWPVPRRNVDLTRVDPLHVGERQAEVTLLAAAAEDESVDRVEVERGRELGVLRIGDDPFDAAELGLATNVAARS